MTTRSTHASRTSKVRGLTSAVSKAWQGARLFDRHVDDIRTGLNRHATAL